jgi:hypothetical protein
LIEISSGDDTDGEWSIRTLAHTSPYQYSSQELVFLVPHVGAVVMFTRGKHLGGSFGLFFKTDLRESHLHLFFSCVRPITWTRWSNAISFCPSDVRHHSKLYIHKCISMLVSIPFHRRASQFSLFIFSCHTLCHIFHQPRHPFLFAHDRNTRFESYKPKPDLLNNSLVTAIAVSDTVAICNRRSKQE